MDISALNTKTGSQKGAFLHLRHPALGHLLYSGEGADALGRAVDMDKVEKAGVTVFGAEAEYVQEQIARIQKLSDDGDKAAAKQRGLDFVCTLVREFHGLTANGLPLGSSDKDKRTFFEQSDGLVEQVIEFARERRNFFSEPPTH